MTKKMFNDLEVPQKTAAQLADILAYRISAGHYADGNALPSCRELAGELQIDKNTVSKAYQLLRKRGLVNSIVGKGVFAVRRGVISSSQGQVVEEAIDAVVWQARALGMAEEELWNLVTRAFWKYFGAAQVKLVLVECNDYEARHMAQQLENHLRVPVDTALLSEFLTDTQHFLDTYDFFVTTFHHLAAVRDATGSENENVQVIGLHSHPVIENMLQIARAKTGAKVGVVCSTEPSVSVLTGLAKSYNADIEVYSHLMVDKTALRGFVEQMDLIVDTMSTHEFVHELVRDIPVVTIAFEIDHQSLSFLKDEIFELIKERVEQPLYTSASGE